MIRLSLTLAAALLAGFPTVLPAAARQSCLVPATETELPQAPPLPSPRPRDLQAEPATPAPKADDNCTTTMRTLGWDAEPAVVDASRDLCKIDTPMRLNRLQLSGTSARSIELPDRPVVACRFAILFGQWIRDLAAPLTLGQLGGELKAINTGSGFECRTRDHLANAKISAHASGIAVDIAGFELADGQHVAVTETANARQVQWLSALRTSACGWFTTILGPGTDPFHATHWHFDILRHGASDYYRICQ